MHRKIITATIDLAHYGLSTLGTYNKCCLRAFLILGNLRFYLFILGRERESARDGAVCTSGGRGADREVEGKISSRLHTE